MTVVRTRTFRSGNSQAIRLPRSVAFSEGTELVVVRSGEVMTIYPAKMSVHDMLIALQKLPAPPEIEKRDEEEIPERPGL